MLAAFCETGTSDGMEMVSVGGKKDKGKEEMLTLPKLNLDLGDTFGETVEQGLRGGLGVCGLLEKFGTGVSERTKRRKGRESVPIPWRWWSGRW